MSRGQSRPWLVRWEWETTSATGWPIESTVSHATKAAAERHATQIKESAAERGMAVTVRVFHRSEAADQ